MKRYPLLFLALTPSANAFLSLDYKVEVTVMTKGEEHVSTYTFKDAEAPPRMISGLPDSINCAVRLVAGSKKNSALIACSPATQPPGGIIIGNLTTCAPAPSHNSIFLRSGDREHMIFFSCIRL